MRNTPTIRNFLYGSGAVLLALVAQQHLENTHFTEAALLYSLAALLFLFGLRTFSLRLAICTEPLGGRDWRQGWPWLLVVVALVLAWFALRGVEDVERPTWDFWRWHIASVLLACTAALLLDMLSVNGAEPPATPNHALTAAFRTRHMTIVLLTLLGVAALLRLVRFADLPFGVWYDEAENGLQALRLIENPSYRPIFVGSIHAPSHYLYLIVAAFEFFGVSIQSIRLVSVLMGLLTVLAAYLVGREFFGRSGGLLLATLLAFSRWNINFSRIGMYNASTPLFELLVVGFLLRGLRRGRFAEYALAGLMLGLGLCFYAAFQLFVAVICLFLLGMVVLERGFLLRTWPGLVLMFAVALLVIAPVLLFAYEKPDVYFSRTQDTSIFAKKSAEERWPALLENIRKHVLMFNYQGDPNGRHNLPGKPMLDPFAGALLVLGLALTLVRLHRPWALLLLFWLGITLLGGILSLDFEAPQSLRAIGAMPAVYLLAVLPLHALWQEWRQGGGRYRPHWVLAPLGLYLGLLSYSNIQLYFGQQAYDFAAWNAFSTPETITANLLTQLDEQTEAYVISFFHGHPTLNFLARAVRPYQRLDTTDHLPLPWPSGKKIALIANAESRVLFEEARHYYPNAYFEEFKAPFGGPSVIYYALLSPEDVSSVQGLWGKYYQDDQWSEPPVFTQQDASLSFDWLAAPPLPTPFSVEWEGVLQVGVYGPHQFFLQSPGYAELYIGESEILTGAGELNNGVVLAQGNHTLRLRAIGAPGPFSLAWRPPDRGPELIPAQSLYVPPVTSNGLLGRYFPNANWQGPEALARIDPQLNLYFHLTPLPRPYTAEWSGKIAIPQPGLYRFGLESINEASLLINGQAVVASNEPNVYVDGQIELEAGLQDVLIRYADRTDHTHINLYWAPPESGPQLIPSAVLFPPQGNYERVTMPSLASLIFDPDSPAAPQIVTAPLAGQVQAVQSGLRQPRGVAIGLDGAVYVADSGNRRVIKLAPDVGVQIELESGDQPWQEPFDLDVDSQGNLYVLEPTQARLAQFDAEGAYLGDVAVDPALIERSRGLHIDAQDRLWIANTPRGRVIALDPTGAVVQEIPVWSGQDSQPVDVAVGSDGSIFVTDAGLHKLVRFDASGRRLLAWEIPVANSVDGSHLAVDEQGALYLTQPEKALVAKHDAQGEQLGVWSVAAEKVTVKPVGVAIGADGRVWFVDSNGGNLFVIETVGEGQTR
jgi:streptogramin lyase/4-amino-4-deoxy-L-arabinose transferase-like glycosyltransferase